MPRESVFFVPHETKQSTSIYNDSLMRAVKKGDVDTVDLLLNDGVVSRLVLVKAFYLAVRSSKNTVVSRLLNAAMDEDRREMLTADALCLAAINGRAEIVNTLLNATEFENLKQSMLEDCSALIKAAHNGCDEAVSILLSEATDSNKYKMLSIGDYRAMRCAVKYALMPRERFSVTISLLDAGRKHQFVATVNELLFYAYRLSDDGIIYNKLLTILPKACKSSYEKAVRNGPAGKLSTLAALQRSFNQECENMMASTSTHWNKALPSVHEKHELPSKCSCVIF